MVIVGMWVMGVYNGLIRKRNAKDNNYSQIGIQLTRKYELIPNLVKLVKGYMKHERTTLELKSGLNKYGIMRVIMDYQKY